MPRTITEDEFWARTDRRKPNGCWKWTRCRQTRNGRLRYGTLRFRGATWLTHRLAWSFTYGPIPAGLSVLHKCDDEACINPDHLFIGTQNDNMLDMKVKGRRRGRGRGETNGRAKLSWKDVEKIRRLYREDPSRWKQTALATRFGISQGMISAIIRRQNWKTAA